MVNRTAILMTNSGGILEMKVPYPVPVRITLDSQDVEKLDLAQNSEHLVWRSPVQQKAAESDFILWEYHRFVGVNDTAAVYLEVANCGVQP